MPVPLAERILKSEGGGRLRTTDLTDLSSQAGNAASSCGTRGKTLNFSDVPHPFD